MLLKLFGTLVISTLKNNLLIGIKVILILFYLHRLFLSFILINIQDLQLTNLFSPNEIVQYQPYQRPKHLPLSFCYNI